ncbi:MAG: tyrosine recombinase XerC [Clostridia bacterium]|nr:tyrosine recombinase XerC [Clostridia bacterium]
MKREEFVFLPMDVQEFLTNLTVVSNRSELTILEYASDLRLFFRYMLKQKDPSLSNIPFNEISIKDITTDFIASITYPDVLGFLTYCKIERNISSRTLMRKITSLRVFYKFLMHNKRVDSSPLSDLDSPKTGKSLPKHLSLEQSRMLLNCVGGDNKERDYCIITFFLNCGIRLSELVALNLNSISDDGKMTVTGKGNKQRIVYLNDTCIHALKEYLKVRPNEGVIDKNALFISRNKKRISKRTVQHIVTVCLERSGLSGQGFSTHKLRHTAATLMYKYGDVDVLLLKEILGHENLSTTQIYTHVSNDQIKKAFSDNPLNDLALPSDEDDDE